jgi:hypothetical protein
MDSSSGLQPAIGPLGVCPSGAWPPPAIGAWASVYGIHEQFNSSSNVNLNGILIVESAVNFDNNAAGGPSTFDLPVGQSMGISSGFNQTYHCNQPPWPFDLAPQTQVISSRSVR